MHELDALVLPEEMKDLSISNDSFSLKIGDLFDRKELEKKLKEQ